MLSNTLQSREVCSIALHQAGALQAQAGHLGRDLPA